MYKLDEVIEHFQQLDLRAKDDYQTVSMEDLDQIDWLIEQAEKVEQQKQEIEELKKSLEGFVKAVEIYSEMPVKEAMEKLIKIVNEQ